MPRTGEQGAHRRVPSTTDEAILSRNLGQIGHRSLTHAIGSFYLLNSIRTAVAFPSRTFGTDMTPLDDRNGVMSHHRRKSQKVGEGTPRVGPPVGRFGPLVCLQLSRWGQSLSGTRGPSTSGPFAGPSFPPNSTARLVKVLQPCSPSCAVPRQRS